MTRPKSYILCANPRSGSTLLAYLLISTRTLGVPREWIRSDGGAAHQDMTTYPSDLASQIDLMIKEGTTENGLTGLKMFPEHFDGSGEIAWATKMPDPHFLYLTREDLLDQAISLAIARQTHSYWHMTPEKADAVFDPDQIDRCLQFIASGEARWRLFFATNGITPMMMTYEQILADPQGCVDKISDWLGVGRSSIDWPVVLVEPQRRARNSEWRERFLAARCDLSALPVLVPIANSQTVSALHP